jgi:uncharacterized protein YndB with AHSA1/START domain
MRGLIAALILGGVAAGAPARAEVEQATPVMFDIEQNLTIDAPVQQVWDTLRSPQKWWSHDHTYTDNSANLYLDSQATGCFCEKIPGKGSVEHGRIVFIQAPRALRLSAALGPLQAEAVTGTLTIVLAPEGDKATKVSLAYIVSGYAKGGLDAIAPKVDDVLAVQMKGLKTAAEAPPAPAPADEGEAKK